MTNNNKVDDGKGYLRCIKHLCPTFKPTENQKKIITVLKLYFNSDPEFEERGFGKLNKGILLAGNIGTGKSLLMNAAQGNPRANYRSKSTTSVSDAYQELGLEGIKCFYSTRKFYNVNGYGSYLGYCFDDLGCEPESTKYMGNELNVMARIILERYEQKHTLPFYFTHFTTNLSGDQIGSVYGKRILSRLHEMCNLIVLEGEDQRMTY